MSLPSDSWDLNAPRKKRVESLLGVPSADPNDLIREMHAELQRLAARDTSINPFPGAEIRALVMSVKELKATDIALYAGNPVVDHLMNSAAWREAANTSMFIKIKASVGFYHSWINDPYEVPSSKDALPVDQQRAAMYSTFYGVLGKEETKPAPKQIVRVKFSDPNDISTGLYLGVASAPFGGGSAMTAGESDEGSRKAFNNAGKSAALDTLIRQ